MDVLLVNYYDINGGAARASYRIHNALLSVGVNSRMLVLSKSSDDPTVIKYKPDTNRVKRKVKKLKESWRTLPLKRYKNRPGTLFSPALVKKEPGIIAYINQLNPDIVHLNWVTNGMIHPEDLINIKAPVVWSLHDMWPFTGGCHYDEECGRYKNGCGGCPILASEKENDLSTEVFKRKVKSFREKESLTVVGSSKWMASCAKSSQVFSEAKVMNLPTPIDTEAFQPFSKDKARELLNLPKEKKIILFGAVFATSSHRKGFHKLSGALKEINPDDTELVVFGSKEPKKSQGFKQKAHYLGRIQDDLILRVLYCAADVVIVPSLQENLSNCILESLACGTPVVGFDIGGNSDMIDHKMNGYLAKPNNVSDLAKGINWILNESDLNDLANYARQKALKNFDYKIVAQKYLELFNGLLNNQNIKFNMSRNMQEKNLQSDFLNIP